MISSRKPSSNHVLVDVDFSSSLCAGASFCRFLYIESACSLSRALLIFGAVVLQASFAP
jgi:hypothetical protein